ncbi:uncharacterized protein GLRG_04907 [Colletotrichum graminicola M1.001]|uniref:Uncharacterized protein n=1 Tax=Colletotrichum graminicola (strain M1.001 / M2 / FGSC 10212) TaxID=645133 RepID=E3QFS8_COLGM|nr:uncharacterized protein GLRG_04907 [Colletotrichum graminicola M1.001]EFQ29763.1 hypothetical protein GLRG_04907 [Colletotrichum graminicola M1.001]
MTCALSLEYDASVLAFDEIWADLENDLGKATQDPNIYTLGRIGKCNVIPVLLLDMGQVNTASASQSSLQFSQAQAGPSLWRMWQRPQH